MFDINDSAKGGGYRRVEVLTGPGRRRRWSVEEKARAVAESLAPEAVVSGVARRWGVLPQQLFAWRREAREGLLGAAMQAVSGGAGRPALATLPSFVPIVAAAPPVAGAVTGGVIEVVLAGAVVRVPAGGADAGALASVLRAVRASAA